MLHLLVDSAYLSDAILCHVLLYFYKLKIYLCNVLFRQSSLARVRMKRESGESPEQSRCCKLHLLGLLIELQKPLSGICGWEGEQAGVSQKTCKTYIILRSRGKDSKV